MSKLFLVPVKLKSANEKRIMETQGYLFKKVSQQDLTPTKMGLKG